MRYRPRHRRFVEPRRDHHLWRQRDHQPGACQRRRSETRHHVGCLARGTTHSTPFFLPDGRHFLYTTYSAQIRLTPCRSSIKAGTNEFHDGLFEYVATTSSIHLRPSTVRRFPRSVESVQYPTRRTSNRNKTFPSNTPRNRNPEIFREIYSPPRRAHVEHSISGIFHHESWKAQLDSPPPREPPPH
jgi:hypothetical protein